MVLLPVQRLLAQADLFDERAWIIIIVAIASAVGGLLKKRKSEQQGDKGEQPSQPPRRTPAGARGPRPPSPQPAGPPRPARVPPARPIPEPIEVASRPPRPVPTPSTDEAERLRTMRAKLEAKQALEARRAPDAKLPTKVAKLKPITPAVRAKPLPREQPAGVARAQVERLLTDRSGAAAAILASEILGPPLALREQQF